MPDPIPLFSPGYKSRSSAVTAVSLRNLFLAPSEDRGAPILAYPTPGLRLFGRLPMGPARGAYVSSAFPTRMYVASDASLYEVSLDASSTIRGALGNSSGRVGMSDNGDQLTSVDGTKGSVLNMSTNVFSDITDPEFPDTARTVTFLDGYTIVERPGTGLFQISELFDSSVWNGLDVEAAGSSPDVALAVLSYGGYLQVYGERSVEYFSNTGSLSFPLARVQGANLEYGIAATATLTPVDESVIFLGRNRLGEVALVQAGAGGGTKVISTPEVNYLWNDKDFYPTTLDATGFAYRLDGRTFYEITFPSAGKSWLLNVSGGSWSEVGPSIGRHKPSIGIAFGEKYIVFDSQTADMYVLDKKVFSDNGMPIVREITSRHVFAQSYNKMTGYRVRLDVESGVGLAAGQGSDPQVGLEISRDGGKSFGNKIWRSMGRIGEYRKTIQWNRIGRTSKDYTFRFTMSDPVPFNAMGSYGMISESMS